MKLLVESTLQLCIFSNQNEIFKMHIFTITYFLVVGLLNVNGDKNCSFPKPNYCMTEICEYSIQDKKLFELEHDCYDDNGISHTSIILDCLFKDNTTIFLNSLHEV